MPIDFNSLFSSAVSQLTDLSTAVSAVLIVFSSLYITILVWHFVRDILSELGDGEGVDDDYNRANEGYMFDGDPSDDAAMDEFLDESEARYREYITTDDD